MYDVKYQKHIDAFEDYLFPDQHRAFNGRTHTVTNPPIPCKHARVNYSMPASCADCGKILGEPIQVVSKEEFMKRRNLTEEQYDRLFSREAARPAP